MCMDEGEPLPDDWEEKEDEERCEKERERERSGRTQDSEGEECWEYPEEGVFGFDRLYKDGLPARRMLACMWERAEVG